MLRDFQTKAMFNRIATGYDFQNSFLSSGMDILWRRELAYCIEQRGRALILDAASGTGEVAMEICRRRPHAKVIGVDFSTNMLAEAKKKIGARSMGYCINLVVGDGRNIPFRSGIFDVLTIAFGIRNIQERSMALGEFERILRPGGQLVIMEFGIPGQPIIKRLYGAYMDRVLGPLGNWISGTDYAYSSLVESIRGFPDEEKFLREIEKAGFTGVLAKRLTYGIAKIYLGIKLSCK